MAQNEIEKQLTHLTERYPSLLPVMGDIEKAYLLLEKCYQNGGKLLIAGNGGSAADGEHIAGELLKSFCLSRRLPDAVRDKLTAVSPVLGEQVYTHLEGGLPAIPLSALESFFTAYTNDRPDGSAFVYAQAVSALGRAGDSLLLLSTSGNSENIVNAAVAARAFEIPVIALTGEGGGSLAAYADVCIRVPEKETYKVQELHMPVYHALCRMLEARFFGETE